METPEESRYKVAVLLTDLLHAHEKVVKQLQGGDAHALADAIIDRNAIRNAILELIA